MLTIYKYQLSEDVTQNIMLPVGAKILSVAVQRGVICLWALVDTNKRSERRTFVVYGTGWPVVDDPLIFIGTVFLDGLVFHVFEILNIPAGA